MNSRLRIKRIASRFFLLLFVSFIVAYGCGGGGGGGGDGDSTPPPATSEEQFAASAVIGELLSYEIDLENLTYSYDIIESEYGYEGEKVSGTLVKNVDGTYSPSDNPDVVIMHLNEFIAGGAEIGGNNVLFAGVPKIAGNYTASEIKGVYNYASFECDDVLVGGHCVDGYYAYLGTFELNANGTLRICTAGNILDNDPNKCTYGIVEGTGTDNGNGTISAIVGGVVIAKAMFLPDTGTSKVMIGDTKESGDPDGTHPGIFIGIQQRDMTTVNISGTYHFYENNGSYGHVTVDDAADEYTGTYYDAENNFNELPLSGTITRNDPFIGWGRAEGSLGGGFVLLLPEVGVYVSGVSGQDWIEIGAKVSASGAITAPVAPSNLEATAISSSTVSLTWTDNSNDEDGFIIERSLSSGSGYAQIDTVAPNIQGYLDTNLNTSTQYFYRVRAYNSVGNSNYSNIDSATPVTPSFTLTVNKSGVGSGTVTGTGINCGSDCTENFTSGVQVVLTASPDGDYSSFSGWSGCDSSSSYSCTVNMNQDRIVAASFALSFNTSITITLPSTSTDGNYTLGWDVTGGLASTTWRIQEDSDSSFSSPTDYWKYNTIPPASYPFTGKSDGTYCYRVGMSWAGSWIFSESACITVARPTSAILRIVNNTHYDMIDIRLNGYQLVSYPYGIAAGQSHDFVFTTPGVVNYYIGVGFYDQNQNRNIWFDSTSSKNVYAGQTTTLTINNPSIAQLLSNFSSYRDWSGEYLCYSCNPIIGYATFRFYSNGTWNLYNNGVYQSSGSVTEVSWPDYSFFVYFKLCPTCDNIQLPYPFGSFLYNNGPADWPIIKYTAQ